ncbi:holin [Streptomyces sp. SID3343]|nr:holin [Streptomyces sp. SID3343]
MWTRVFWRAAGERAIRTAAQAELALLGVGSVGLLDVDWVAAASLGGGAALASVLTSITLSGVGPSGPGLTEAAETARDADVRRLLSVRGRE